jgi:hypothetical protein
MAMAFFTLFVIAIVGHIPSSWTSVGFSFHSPRTKS